MSDTAAFLAGCAVTGVAVIFVMRNDFADGPARVSSSPSFSSPTPEVSITPVPVPILPGSSENDERAFRLENGLDQQQNLSRDLSDQLRRQQDRTEDLKGELERQQRETETLKEQLDQQQRHTDQLISQLQEQQRLLDRLANDRESNYPAQLPLPVDTSIQKDATDSRIQAVITGVVGIIVLVVVAGGGLILFAIILVVVISSRQRQTRTVHVVHPYPPSYGTLAGQPLLPARVRPRPPRQIEVEYYGGDNYD